MSSIFFDDFNRPDEALTASPDWETRSDGLQNDLSIVSGSVVTDVDYGQARVSGKSVPADQWVEIDVLDRGSEAFQIVLRGQDTPASDCYRVLFRDTGPQIAKIVNGTYTILDSIAQANSKSNHTVRGEVQGNIIKVFVDGAEQLSYTDAANTFTSGQPGIAAGQVSPTKIATFETGDFTLPPSITVTQTELTPDGTISGTYADYTTTPTTLEGIRGSNVISSAGASPQITGLNITPDADPASGSFTATISPLVSTGTQQFLRFSDSVQGVVDPTWRLS